MIERTNSWETIRTYSQEGIQVQINQLIQNNDEDDDIESSNRVISNNNSQSQLEENQNADADSAN